MKKTLVKSLAMAFVGSLLVAGSAMALPSEWGAISPASLTGAPVYNSTTDFGYYIWTDDVARTSWHIRWMDGVTDGLDVFSGIIALENNTGTFTTYSFEAADTNFTLPTGDTYISFIKQGQDGLDFTINQTSAPSYVGFDLFYNLAGMNANSIFLGGIEQTVASLGQDQDFKIAAPVAPVPEPATMLLLGTGLAGLAGAQRRKAKK